MFSQGLSSLKNAASTETRFTCRRTDSGSATTSHPNTMARPASGVSNVPRMRINVDFPLPFGPRIPVMPPASMTRSSSWRATLSFHSRRHQGAPASRSRRRNAFLTPRISIAVTAHLPKISSCDAPPALRATSPRGGECQAKEKGPPRCPTTARSFRCLY